MSVFHDDILSLTINLLMHIIMNNLNFSLASMYLMYIYFIRGLCNMLLHAKTTQKTLTLKKAVKEACP